MFWLAFGATFLTLGLVGVVLSVYWLTTSPKPRYRRRGGN